MSRLLFNGFEATATAVGLPPPPTTLLTGFASLVARTDKTARLFLGGESVIYRPAIGIPVSAVGIFDESYVFAKGTAEAGVESVSPAVFLQLADLPVDPEIDDPILTIRTVNYRVIGRRAADFGSVVLALRQIVD